MHQPVETLVWGLGFETPVRRCEEWDHQVVQDNKTMLDLAQNFLLKHVKLLGPLSLFHLNLLKQSVVEIYVLLHLSHPALRCKLSRQLT